MSGNPGVLRLACTSPALLTQVCLCCLGRYVKDRALSAQLGRARFTQPEDRWGPWGRPSWLPSCQCS